MARNKPVTLRAINFSRGFALALGNINDIAMFVAVVRAGSFTIAAKQLGLTRSAVGKSIVRLEQRLGVRLLNRTPRSLSLTDDGDVFFSRCTQILDDLEETELAMAVRSAKPTGVLRVSVPIGLGHRHVNRFSKHGPTCRGELYRSLR
jgi:DNA-binding transcriptional LysR family regulator